MRKFFTILPAIFVCIFSITSVWGQEDKNAQQRMAQLQQILERAARSGAGNASAEADIPLQGVNQTSSSAGLVSSPSAILGVTNTAGMSVPAVGIGNNLKNSKRTNAYDEAFSNVVNQLLPMSPAQVAKLREVYTESQMVAATPPGVPPKPTSASLMIDLSPQATPPVIRLGAGYITSLVFMDATGQPWPIKAYSVGDPSSFNIQWDRKGNTLLVQSATFYKRSNMAVILQGLNTPVMVDLVSGQKAVDYRVDLRVPGIGPNASFAHSGIPQAASPVLLSVLNGVPPKGSKELKVSGGHCQAWLLDKKVYLRTKLNIISPGWQSIMSNIDGTHAYQLQPAPIILALQNGRDKVLTLMLEGLE